VVLDGLVASCVPEVLVPESRRLRLVALVHLPLGSGRSPDGRATREQEVLAASAAVLTTSGWTRSWLLERYSLAPDLVHVARPGVDVADLVAGTASGGELLCVGAVLPDKGHDVLLAALAGVAERTWSLTCVGSLARDPAFVDHLGRRAQEAGIGDRVRFTGPLTRADLAKEYAAADVLVQPSLAETYGMVVTEALARGLPVLATRVGGLPEALGRGAGAGTPGLLVPPGDPVRLADALRWWLEDAELRRRLRRAARERRSALSGWSTTARRVSHVLAGVTR
jgi:glycosyltransferase involved in cell wall biosynthesis